MLSDFDWTLAPDGTNAANLTSTQYLEHKDSGREAYSPGNSTANRVFIVNWADRAAFLDALLGYSFYQGDVPGGSSSSSASSSSGFNYNISRILPDAHPDILAFYATDATVRGIGVLSHNENNAIGWTSAVIEANYKPLPYAILEDYEIVTEQDRYTERVQTFSSEYLTVQGNMQWVQDNLILAAQPGKITGSIGYTYTWHEVPGKVNTAYADFTPPNLNNVQACLGTINSLPFDVNGINAPPGTMLFLGAEPKMITPKLNNINISSAYFYWEIVMTFLYRYNGLWSLDHETPCGHNFLYDTNTGKWDLVTNNSFSSGTPIYQSTDLNQLWVVT